MSDNRVPRKMARRRVQRIRMAGIEGDIVLVLDDEDLFRSAAGATEGAPRSRSPPPPRYQPASSPSTPRYTSRSSQKPKLRFQANLGKKNGAGPASSTSRSSASTQESQRQRKRQRPNRSQEAGRRPGWQSSYEAVELLDEHDFYGHHNDPASPFHLDDDVESILLDMVEKSVWDEEEEFDGVPTDPFMAEQHWALRPTEEEEEEEEEVEEIWAEEEDIVENREPEMMGEGEIEGNQVKEEEKGEEIPTEDSEPELGMMGNPTRRRLERMVA